MALDTTFRSSSNRTQTRGETETERDAGTQRRGPVYALKGGDRGREKCRDTETWASLCSETYCKNKVCG